MEGGNAVAMPITIPHDLEERLLNQAQAEGLSVQQYLDRLLREQEEWAERTEPFDNETDPEFHDIRAAVTEGLEQAERGECQPAEAVFAELRSKHGISR